MLTEVNWRRMTVRLRSTTLSDSELSHDYTLILERCIEFAEVKPKQYVETFLQGQQGEFVYNVRRNHMDWRILKVFRKNLCRE